MGISPAASHCSCPSRSGATRGRWRWLERLQGELDPESLLATVAGIGPGLAACIHQELGIETLEDLEVAAHDGRLARVDGFGPKRVQSVIDSLEMLEIKTEGNLTSEEERLLHTALTNLRPLYEKASD